VYLFIYLFFFRQTFATVHLRTSRLVWFVWKNIFIISSSDYKVRNSDGVLLYISILTGKDSSTFIFSELFRNTITPRSENHKGAVCPPVWTSAVCVPQTTLNYTLHYTILH